MSNNTIQGNFLCIILKGIVHLLTLFTKPKPKHLDPKAWQVFMKLLTQKVVVFLHHTEELSVLSVCPWARQQSSEPWSPAVPLLSAWKGKCKLDTEAPFPCHVIRSPGHKTCSLYERRAGRQTAEQKQTLCVFDMVDLGMCSKEADMPNLLELKQTVNGRATTGPVLSLSVSDCTAAGRGRWHHYCVCGISRIHTNVELYLWGLLLFYYFIAL